MTVLLHTSHNVSTVCKSIETKYAELYDYNQIIKEESMKIQKGQPEITNRRTDKMHKRSNNDPQNTTKNHKE